MSEIVYILGAGASAGALPIVNSTSDGKIKGLADDFERLAKEVSLRRQFVNAVDDRLLKEFAFELLVLAEKSRQFGTVDTYCKYLYMTNPTAFASAKNTLSLYFTYIQLAENKFDSRYLGFITSILNGSSFPSNVSVITWNYDFQLIHAAYQFTKEEYSEGQVHVLHPTVLKYYPKFGFSFPEHSDDWEKVQLPSLLHLNGIAGFYQKGDTYSSMSILNKFYGQLDLQIDHLLRYYLENVDTNIFKPLLQFAWEADEGRQIAQMKRTLELADKMVESCQTLVIVGYSFPFFNRSVDRRIFTKILSQNTLRRIHFQDPYLDGEFLRSYFQIPNDIPIIHEKRIDSFHIPRTL